MENQKLITFKNVIDDKFPSLLKKISFNEISTILILQIKGGDVHPNNRHPNIKGKKTQIDITASMKLPPEQSPVCALVTPGPNSPNYHPIELFHPIEKKWMTRNMKVTPGIARGPAPNQARILLGGMDPNSWSSELWANMGHYVNDKWGHIIFVRGGNKTPLCFSLPRNEELEKMLLDGGKRRGESPKYRYLTGSPIKKSLVIVGQKSVDQSLKSEYLYIVTSPKLVGWVKIGKTEQDPKNRLNGYRRGPDKFDMNYIFLTSNCHEAEREVISRLSPLGYERDGKEFFKHGTLEIAKNVIKEVIKSYPPPLEMDIKPIINSDSSWAYSN